MQDGMHSGHHRSPLWRPELRQCATAEAVAGTPSTRGWGGGQTSSLSQEDQSRPAGSDQQNPGVQQDQEVSNSGTEQSEKVSNTREHESEEVTKSCSQYWQARLSEKDHEVSKS